MFKAGDKVVCVQGKSSKSQVADHFYPVQGEIYTVASVDNSEDNNCFYVSLVEDTFHGAAWDLDRFVIVSEARAGLDSEKFSEIQNKVIAAIDEAVKLPNAQGGIKFDLGKKDYTLLLQDLKVTVDEVTDVLELGAKKYARGNYKLIESDRYHKAMLRHIMSYLSGELTDPETGKHHLAHAICCAAFLIEREVNKNETTSS